VNDEVSKYSLGLWTVVGVMLVTFTLMSVQSIQGGEIPVVQAGEPCPVGNVPGSK